MKLDKVTIPRTEARQAYLDYRREAQRTNDPEARAELEQMARAFREAAKEDVALISLTQTLRRGGTMVRTLVQGSRDEQRREQYLLPRLAVGPADGRFVWTRGVQADGTVEFIDRLRTGYQYRRGVREVAAGFELPDGFSRGSSLVGSWASRAWMAMVPIVPPKHRPSRGLGRRDVLFEVDEWAWAADPDAPEDPALIKRVGGDVYVVEAVWALTELERLVLAGRRP